jgi:glycerol uptake facilitator-like aquaporin
MIEVVTTFNFVLINLLVKNGKTSPSSDGFLSGLAVSFTLLAMICISAGKSGACMNPAVAIAQTIFEVTQYGNQIPGDKWVGKYFTDYIFLYLFATFLGAIKGKSKSGKIKISYYDSNGYKKYSYVTPTELKVMARVINYTIEK